jgi:hypothetical protein
MPSRLRVEVTAEHIRYGEPRHMGRCPIALAIKAADPDDIVMVRVDRHSIGWSRRSTDTRYAIRPVPRRLRRWMERLDEGRERVRPFSFELDEAAAATRPVRHSGWAGLAASRPTGGPRVRDMSSMSYRPALSELAAMAREQAS